MAQQEVFDQAQYPWQTVVFIESTFPNGDTATGSGVMVGPNDVLTASHMVYAIEDGGGATKVTVTPGYDPSPLQEPFGTVDAYAWHYFTDFDPDGNGLILPGNNGDGLGGSELDVALLDLDVALGINTGWMGLDRNFTSGNVNVTGYPGYYGTNMMNDVGYVKDDAVDWFTDTDGLELHAGNSGGPLWHYNVDGSPSVVGIVSTETAACDIAGTYDTILEWTVGNDSLLFIV
jgi:V8-like Glu-specific endopeptidase